MENIFLSERNNVLHKYDFTFAIAFKHLKLIFKNIIPPKIITPKYKIMIVKEIRLFSYISGIIKELKLLFSYLIVGEIQRDFKEVINSYNNPVMSVILSFILNISTEIYLF